MIRPTQEVRTRRLVMLALGIVSLYSLLLARSFELQVFRADALQIRQQGQIAQHEVLPGRRGDVLDRNGVLLATSIWRHQVLVDTRQLTPDARRSLLRTVTRITGEPSARLRERLDRRRGLVRLVYGLRESETAALRAADLPYVRIEPIRLRSYPTQERPAPPLAAAYTGFVGVEGKGLAGVELGYDTELRGPAVEQNVKRDGRRRRLLDLYPSVGDRTGERVRLALDANLQLQAERALESALERTGARSASLIALDPYTGDVLVSAEVPGFDSNRFWAENPAHFRARGWTDEFEPGSTLKPFVAALALERGVLTVEEELDAAPIRIGRHVIRDPVSRERLALAEALEVSSNVFAARVAQRLGPGALVEGLRQFGFGEPLETPFPGAADGSLREPGRSQPLDAAVLGFGQGMRASLAQLAVAGAILANGGRAIAPRVPLEVGTHAVPPQLSSRRVISEQTARTVVSLLERVVADGTGRAAALEHYRVAGKTGTAQKFIEGAYSHDRVVASFLGIAPAQSPRLVIAVAIDEPTRNASGGEAAAPVFAELAAAALRALEVPAELPPQVAALKAKP